MRAFLRFCNLCQHREQTGEWPSLDSGDAAAGLVVDSVAESVGESDREAREQAAAESILALWQRRAGLPGDRPPMHAFERVFLTRQAEKHAAGVARPWPSVKQPTVRTDRPGGTDAVRLPALPQ
jgi:hypothetical protein